LADFLLAERIDCVVDATHPFAETISENARRACEVKGVPLVVLARAPWKKSAADRWIEVGDGAAAAKALGAAPRRVFLAIGRQGVAVFRAAPQHDYLLRVIETPDDNALPPRCELIVGRGPFSVDDETRLMRDKRIDVVVTKNSGGPLTYAKIEAARALSLPVVMIAPPVRRGEKNVVHDIDAVMAVLAS
ncbi:MAG: cobalt-precorrin-6A reductase, partial [Methylocystis sp.]|nr:cobalt-precorrin-6A reductase [Methylocystis sp.]